MAMVNCNTSMMDYFLTASGVSVDARKPANGITALHFACAHEKLSDADSHTVARCSVEEKGADPTLQCGHGFTPAVYARHQKKMRTYKYLMQRANSSR
jgi:hypothetical protein